MEKWCRLGSEHRVRLHASSADKHHRHRRLLRARRERPRRRSAAEERDEVPPVHSITSSTATSSLSGTVRPSILAVEALMTSSNLLDCTTGKSAGFAPLRIRPVYTPMWRYATTRLAP